VGRIRNLLLIFYWSKFIILTILLLAIEDRGNTMLYFWLWFYGLFDWLFKKEKRQERRDLRSEIRRIASFPQEIWGIAWNYGFPCFFVKPDFSSEPQEKLVSIRFVKYGQCIDGVEVYCYGIYWLNELKIRGEYYCSLIDQFAFCNLGPTGDIKKTCNLVDKLVKHLKFQLLIKAQIKNHYAKLK